mmetsp:Transcript_40600/g.52290  ORF Transcript_40600/g.52290 Transcript_40600/m.52290 type:complete len:324 (-) Transcript_40600:252-1223(-)
MQNIRHSLAVRRLVRSRLSVSGETSRWNDMKNRLFPHFGTTLTRLLSSSPWVNTWLDKLQISYPPPEKYLPENGPATASSIYDRMLVIGHHRNKLSRVALHYLLRACHQPGDLDIARDALKLYQGKAIEITEETSLLYVKACCRIGEPLEALKGFLDSTMRVGLWSNATAWNYLMIKLDNKMIDPKEFMKSSSLEKKTISEENHQEEESNEEEDTLEKKSAVLLAFEEMQRIGVKPNGQTYHIVIRALLLLDDKVGIELLVTRANIEGQLQPSTTLMIQEGIPLSDNNTGLITDSNGIGDIDAVNDYIDEAAFPPEANQEFVK